MLGKLIKNKTQGHQIKNLYIKNKTNISSKINCYISLFKPKRIQRHLCQVV